MKEQTKNQVLAISKVSNSTLISRRRPSQINMTPVNALSDVVRPMVLAKLKLTLAVGQQKLKRQNREQSYMQQLTLQKVLQLKW